MFAFLGVGCQGLTLSDAKQSNLPSPGGAPTIGEFVRPGGDPSSPDACAGISLAASVASLRRLGVDEQRNSFRDILGDQTLAPQLAPAAGAIITEQEVEQLNVAVAALISTQKHLTYLPCSATGGFNSVCADTFIADFGKMAFRRPLTDAEKLWLKQEVYEGVRTNPELSPPATFREAIDTVAQAVLQSPQLLYVLKEGVNDPSIPAGIRRLTGYERATDLSYLLWGSTPDKVLLAAAEAGDLDSAEGVRAQAERLLASPRSRNAVRSFVSSWLQLDGNSHQASLESAPKSATAFPFDSPALRTAMREEVQALYEKTFFEGAGSFKSLMTSRQAYVNKSLGELYGVANPPASDSAYSWVTLNPEQRSGLFTRAAFLSLYAPQEQKSPIRRGVFLFRQALCQPMGDPPANVNNVPIPPADHPRTTREQVESRTAPPTCQACHGRINPLGFTLENYDAMGQFTTTEAVTFNNQPVALPVNPSTVPVATDFDSPLSGPIALSDKLGDSGMARDCMASTWFVHANPRTLTSTDACSMQRLMRRFRRLMTCATCSWALHRMRARSSSWRHREEENLEEPALPAQTHPPGVRWPGHRPASLGVHLEPGHGAGDASAQALRHLLRARWHPDEPYVRSLRFQRVYGRKC